MPCNGRRLRVASRAPSLVQCPAFQLATRLIGPWSMRSSRKRKDKGEVETFTDIGPHSRFCASLGDFCQRRQESIGEAITQERRLPQWSARHCREKLASH